MSDPPWQTIKKLAHDRARGRCEYCQTDEINIGQSMHVEHIRPGEGDDSDNLCLACPNCNLSKAAAVTAVDPEIGQEVPLFHPRLQKWADHFAWEDDYTLIRGITPIGRATVIRLKMNRPRIKLSRRRWVQAGLHPASEMKG